MLIYAYVINFVGPVMKVNASKVDYCDGPVQETIQELALRARLETEALLVQDAAQAVVDAERAALAQAQAQEGAKRDKKKKLKSDHRGNYSSFRNKSFIPNASRAGKARANSLELLQEMVGAPKSDDDEEDD